MTTIALDGAPRTERAVPRWAGRVAHAIPLLTLPSGLWRIGLVLGFSMGGLDDAGNPVFVTGGEAVYVAGLSVFSECVALLAFGLVRPWGEVVPRWIPLLGGRRVPPYAAVTAATLGALALIAIWGFAFRDGLSPEGLHFSSTGWDVLLVACYLPLLLWGPLLLVLTWAYWRRRRWSRRTSASGPRCTAPSSGGTTRPWTNHAAPGRTAGTAAAADVDLGGTP